MKDTFDEVNFGLHVENPLLTNEGELMVVVQYRLFANVWGISAHVRVVGMWSLRLCTKANPPKNEEERKQMCAALADMVSAANGGLPVSLFGRMW
jgi:hypothetical protein